MNTNGISGSIYDYGQYNKRPVTTTRTTKTTTKEFDKHGKVTKEITVEETTTTTQDYYPWYGTTTTNPTITNTNGLDVKYGRSNTLELPLE